MTLAWTAGAGYGTETIFDKYQYRQSTDGGRNYGPWMDGSGTSTSHTLMGLRTGTACTFQVRAVNRHGNAASAR